MINHDFKSYTSKGEDDPLLKTLKRDEKLPDERDVKNAQQRLLARISQNENSGLGFIEWLRENLMIKPALPMAAFASVVIMMAAVLLMSENIPFDQTGQFDIASVQEPWMAYEAAAQSEDMNMTLDSLMLDDLDDVFL